MLLTLLLASITIYAQGVNDYCGTPHNSSNFNLMETIRGLDYTHSDFQMKVYVHVIRKSNPANSGQSQLGVNEAMRNLYEDFDPLGIYLVWDGDIDYIDNTNLYDSSVANANALFNINDHNDGIDIYLWDNETFGLGVADGIGENSAFVVGGRFSSPEGDQEYIFVNTATSHEMGHVFYLWHTHHPHDDPNGQDPNSCVEFVNGSINNRAHCGDYIKDTPASPILTQNDVNASCNYTGNATDSNGDPYQPDPTNIMSYGRPICNTNFTSRQKTRMKNAIGYFSFLQDCQLEEFTYIRGSSIVCENDEKNYEIYSDDANALSFQFSNSVSATVTPISSTEINLDVFYNHNDPYEGTSGFIRVLRNGQEVARKDIWVGVPSAVAPNTLSGPENVVSGSQYLYEIPDRLLGTEIYAWDYPGEEEEPENPFNPVETNWQYHPFSLYDRSTPTQAGDCSGYLRALGLNECGDGIENEISVNSNQGQNCDPPPPTPMIVYYPNPADGLLEIDLSLQDYGVFDIIIYDANQNILYQDQSENVVKTIDTFNLPNGTYYLHIYDGGTQLLSVILIINHQ